MSDLDLHMTRGDTPKWHLGFSRGGAAIPLAGASIWMTAKRDLGDTDANAVFQKKTGGTGIVLVGTGSTGEADVTLLKTDTSALLDRDYSLYLDVQVIESTGVVSSFTGRLHVTCDVTETAV